jgi:hypothetical protein
MRWFSHLTSDTTTVCMHMHVHIVRSCHTLAVENRCECVVMSRMHLRMHACMYLYNVYYSYMIRIHESKQSLVFENSFCNAMIHLFGMRMGPFIWYVDDSQHTCTRNPLLKCCHSYVRYVRWRLYSICALVLVLYVRENEPNFGYARWSLICMCTGTLVFDSVWYVDWCSCWMQLWTIGVWAHMCIHTYIHIYMHTYIHISIHTYTRTHVQTRL